MKDTLRKPRLLAIAVLLVAAAGLGETISNWSAPGMWSPPRPSGGKTMMDLSNPLPFIPITPCRIADTRGNGFTGAYGPPALAGGAPRSFTLTGQCGIPTTAEAVSLNITVVNPSGPGFILIYPQGAAQPTVSTLNYLAGQTVANAAIVPLGAGGVTVVAGVSGTNLIIDTNGYYYDSSIGSLELGAGEYFGIVGNRPGTISLGEPVIFGRNRNAAGPNSWGGLFQADSNQDGSAGVVGMTSASTGVLYGVLGRTHSTTAGAAAVKGEQQGTSGGTSGVTGTTASTSLDSTGVRGSVGSGAPLTSVISVGVRGEALGTVSIGVMGISGYVGVAGLFESGGGTAAAGYLGSSIGTAADLTAVNWGVFAQGDLGASGAKHFVEPHGTDATKVIVYSSLEGREVGTYFRGSARTAHGQAIIAVPDDFRTVTDEEGLTVHLTPVGDLVTIAVMSKDLRHIVVRSSKDVEFDYIVHGVRRAFKSFEPVSTGYEFMPKSATERIPPYLTEEAKSRLIANGTYNADGTVNMGTAEKAGWTKTWAEREGKAKGERN